MRQLCMLTPTHGVQMLQVDFDTDIASPGGWLGWVNACMAFWSGWCGIPERRAGGKTEALFETV